jgi:hypothetical protein
MLTAGEIIMIAIFAVLVVVGLAVSLITITLRNIRETNGQIPQWPVSWPEPPKSISRQEESLPRSSDDVDDVPREQAGVPQPPESVPQPRESSSRSPESTSHGGWSRRSRR